MGGQRSRFGLGAWPPLVWLGSLLLLLVFGAGPAQAVTRTVTTNADGGAGSLRQRITQSGAGDVINFNIGGGGLQTITLASALPAITVPVTIDGTTQPGYAGKPLIEIRGPAGGASAGLVLQAGSSGSVITGLCINGFAPGGDGIHIQASSNNVITANYLGTDPAGTGAVANFVGVRIDGAATNNTIGGTAAGAGNLISGNTHGVAINMAGTTGNLVQGNLIGTDWTGNGAIPNAQRGVSFDSGASNNTVGGRLETFPLAGNTIARNGVNGVWMYAAGTVGNAVLGNKIFANTWQGIELNQLPSGGTDWNDTLDIDTGPNNFQNHPILSAAMTNGAGAATLAGSYSSAANTTYRLEFFASVVPDASGYGNGERYLGFTNVTTDANGSAVFGVTLATVLNAGEYVSATATSPSNDTSEFGFDVRAVGSLVVTTTADTVDGTTTSVSALIASPGADSRISLREAITATNNTAGADTIRFGIPLTDTNHRYYRNDAIAGSLTNVQATALADSATPASPAITDFDPDYPAGFTRSWYRIRPASALPDVTGALVIDAETQPGFVSGAPVIELDGTTAGGASNGLSLTTGPGTVRGLVVNRFGNDGLNLRGAGGFTVTGNYLGTDVSGTKGAGNVAGSGVFVTNLTGAPTTIGGSTPAARNVISANGWNGIYVYNYYAPANTVPVVIRGNYIGTDVTGTLGLAVQSRGVVLEYTGGHTIGGSGGGEGNLISGNAGAGIDLNGSYDTGGGAGAPADNNVIEGNRIGTNAAGTAAIPNAGPGIQMYGITDASSSASGNTIRGNVIAASTTANAHGIAAWGNADNNLYEANFIGTDAGGTLDLGNAGSGIHIEAVGAFLPTGNTIRNNTIRFNAVNGVRVLGTGASATLTQNGISGNDALGIDLGGDGVTANDALDADSGPNDLLNFPQIAAASPSAGTLTVNFGLDVPAGSYRVEFFKNPSGADPSGYGEGQAFASSRALTHPGGGTISFNHTFAGNAGDVITATATACTDGAACTTFGSTSEFSNAVVAAPTSAAISGTVFEDMNYGGGAGRDRASASGVARSGARVELYDSAGAFVSFTTTDASGNYSFPGLGAANYTVRVVNSTVTSSRAGYVGTLRPVQTYRTDASTGSAVAVTNYVGGQNPAVADAGNGAAGAVMDTATGVFTAGIGGTAESITNVTLGASNVTGVDFGFNFDTIVNTNDSGQGSLRMLLTNANALGGDAALAQVGLVAGKENAVFMISNGTAAPGLRAANNYFVGGVATITPLSSLPTITSALVLDAQKQPGWAGAPIVELNGASAPGDGLTVSAGSSAVRGLVVNRFSGFGIRLQTLGGNTVAGNYVGTNAAGTAGAANGVDGISIQSSTSNTVGGTTAAERNVVSGNGDDGIEITGATSTGNVVQGNYVGLTAAGTAALSNSNDGVVVWLGTGNTIGGTAAGAGNVIGANDSGIYIGDATATGNSILGNWIGTDATGLVAVGNITGIYLDASSTTVGGTMAGAGNVISGNTWAGLWIAGASGVVAQGNSVGLGVDGTTAVANKYGIYLNAGANGNTIGGAVAGAGNLIARNMDDAIVLVSAAGTGNRINRNSIYSNAGLAVDLNDDGVTANDLADADSGPNGLQNYPALSAAATDGVANVHVAGSLRSGASATYRVEFFAGSAPDPSGHGEGRRYLGFLSVSTDAAGNAVFGGTLAALVTAGEFVSATATDPSGSTSEYAANVTAVGDLVVTTTADTVDGTVTSVASLIANPGGDGRISLREALTATNNTAGTDTIRFGIPLTDTNHRYYRDDAIAGSLTSEQTTTLADAASASSPGITDFDPDYPAGFTRSWYRIQPTSALPTVGDAVVIDGTTQPGSISGGPVVLLDGLNAGAANGLRISAGSSTIRSLVIGRFQQYGIYLETGAGNTIAGNIIGLDVAGVTALGNVLYGINMVGSNGNVIGGTSAADRNVISSNRLGVNVGATSQNELIQGNYIGTDVTGTRTFGNTFDGVWIQSNAGPSTVGGTAPGGGNLISGNGEDGISINGTANGMVVQGNRIGTDVTGLLNLGNAVVGIHLGAGNNHVVGGTSAAARNVICGSGANGMLIPAGTGSTIQGNYIGVGADGATKIANAPNGIDVTGTGTVIGGTAPGAGNVISGNTQSGVYINGANGVVVQGNTIGMDAARTVAVGNQSGVWIGPGTVNSLVGGTTAAAANLIAYNTYVGIGTGATAGSGNAFIGNSIYLNSALGIDLLDNGVTLNDALDVDTGPNDLLNFPQFPPPVESVAGMLSVTYGLDLPMGWYRIEFFKNPIGADPSGYGEGQVFASSVVVYHPGGAPAAYSHSFAGTTGEVVSATTTACTDGAACATPGSTSEFSRAWAAVPTAVRLMSFTATGADRAVDLAWQTGSELDNLGFHLYRGLTESGPWTRLNGSLIPGLGSSPVGASYSWHDGGLVNGTRYYYRLEDVDAASVSTFHGPISAVPSPPGEGGGDGGGGDGTERGISCPTWVLAAAPDAVSPTCTRHGDPDSVSLQILSRDDSGATLELRTGGFWALHEEAGGADAVAQGTVLPETVRVFVPGLEFPTDPRAPALPLRRALVEAVVGRNVELVSAEALDLRAFRGLRPSAVGIPEVAVGGDGTVRPARRPLAAPVLSRGYLPRWVARLAGTVFQGERKSAVVEITPVRFTGSGHGLVQAGTVRVRLAFTGVAEGESGAGSRGRSLPRRRGWSGDVLARLHTSKRGLHAVSFEQLFPQGGRGFSTAFLRLQRQGEAVAFHVEPSGAVFGPGSVLYFLADRTALSTDFSSEVAYELVRSPGVQMGVVTSAPMGEPASSSSMGLASFETNRIYQPGLLEAPDVWLWEAIGSGVTRTKPFTLSGVDASSGERARLVVHLQGASESGLVADHHVRISLNGTGVGETTFAGKRPDRVELSLSASVLKEGDNELALANAGDTGVVSLVFLDRFEVSYPQLSRVREGVFEGTWGEGRPVEIGDLSGMPVILRVSGPPPEGSEALSSVPGGERRGSSIADSSGSVPIGIPRTDHTVSWVTGFQTGPGSVRFQAEAGRRYLVVSPEGLLSPRIAWIPLSSLRDASNQADYLVIAPREMLQAAQPLLDRRRDEGLTSRGIAFEEITSEFGHAQPSAEAIREFLSYAYHSWQRPSPRYVLLLGDSTVDPQRFVATSGPSPLPALWTKTSYLWTVSDPALAAVNGEDLVPDLAIGRLPATTVEEAERLVAKVLAWEETGQGLGGQAVLVADDPDRGGDFEADVEDIRASFLSARPATLLKVGELAGATRAAILGAFDDGASLMSYVGHGGTTVWASENVLNSWDVPSLRGQSRQPLLLTWNCLNGYFVTPNLDSLPEALLKAEGRGAIAAFSPSGLSLDGPAHQYHRAVMAELASGGHARLGDAILAAQRTYAETGLMPELLEVYHLLGDPATRIRP